jgi:DNA-binding transcriptional LysR family regulator
MNLNQEQLYIFKTVMELGSFSAAARHLGKVPSAVSMSIANLEVDLNLALFQRIGREPIPTAQARSLYEKTQHLLVDMQQWRQYAESLSEGLETSLNIVVVSELIHTDWTHYISVLEEKFPQLNINIFTAPQEDATLMLDRGQAQFALMFEREHLKNNEQFIELKQAFLAPVVAKTHAMALKDHVYFADLLNNRQVVIASRNREIKPELLFAKQYWRTDNHHSACAIILKNLAWGVLPLDMLEQNPHLAAQLQILNILDFTPQFDYFVDLVWNRENYMGAAGQYLVQYIQTLRKHNTSR